MQVKREKPKATSDIKLKDVTITFLSKSKSEEEGEGLSPFKASKTLHRSPIVGERKEIEIGEESEGGERSFGVGEHSTLLVKGDKGGRYLARRAVEKSSLARYGKPLPAGSEVEDTAMGEADDPISETEGEEGVHITDCEMRGLTQILVGVV